MKQLPQSNNPFSTAYSLAKTAATGLIICGIISFVAMFFLLQKNYVSGDKLPYYLPWCLGYGIVDLLIAGTGVYWITHEVKKPYEAFVFSIVVIVMATVVLGGSIPYIAIWGNVEFFVSTLVIAACEITIGILAIRSYLERK